jgi:hypothetical protein
VSLRTFKEGPLPNMDPEVTGVWPGAGLTGDLRTCLALILQIDIREVPVLGQRCLGGGCQPPEDLEGWDAVRDWLRPRGYRLRLQDDPPADCPTYIVVGSAQSDGYRPLLLVDPETLAGRFRGARPAALRDTDYVVVIERRVR